jgi:ATP-dependent Zn protease
MSEMKESKSGDDTPLDQATVASNAENDFLQTSCSLNTNTRFYDIIGCDKAKQALQENVIFHLSLSDEVLSSTFTGTLIFPISTSLIN